MDKIEKNEREKLFDRFADWKIERITDDKSFQKAMEDMLDFVEKEKEISYREGLQSHKQPEGDFDGFKLHYVNQPEKQEEWREIEKIVYRTGKSWSPEEQMSYEEYLAREIDLHISQLLSERTFTEKELRIIGGVLEKRNKKFRKDSLPEDVMKPSEDIIKKIYDLLKEEE